MMALADHQLLALLAEDAGYGDLTTESLGIGACWGQLRMSARQPMTVCGTEEAARLFALAGAQAEIIAASGVAVDPGAPLLVASGEAGALHRVWKTAQVLLEWASGVATAAAAIAAAAGIPVACTRKSAPGTKALAIKAVRAGGAIMHRLGLSETLLVFAEHRVFLDEPPAATVARLRRAQPEKRIIVEVADLDEAKTWIEAGADVVQLERFTPAEVAACRRLCAGRPVLLAAAGGIHAGNAADYAAAGADLLVTSAPYQAPPLDVQVRFARQE